MLLMQCRQWKLCVNILIIYNVIVATSNTYRRGHSSIERARLSRICSLCLGNLCLSEAMAERKSDRNFGSRSMKLCEVAAWRMKSEKCELSDMGDRRNDGNGVTLYERINGGKRYTRHNVEKAVGNHHLYAIYKYIENEMIYSALVSNIINIHQIMTTIYWCMCFALHNTYVCKLSMAKCQH